MKETHFSPMSGGVTGSLKQLGVEMTMSPADATSAEEADIDSHGEMVSTKEIEIAA
jgi:hypothetical protein